MGVRPKCFMGIRVFCTITCLEVFDALRYSDTVRTFRIWKTDSAICGVAINVGGKNGDPMKWATPILGISGRRWAESMLSFCGVG